MVKFDLQLFTEPAANTITTTDVEPAISVDYASRLKDSITEFQKLLGIPEMIPMAEGTGIKIYKLSQVNTPEQVGEGVTIPLTEIKRELDRTIPIGLNKYRKNTTAEAIQKSGKEIAVNLTDEKLIKGIRKEIKAQFFSDLVPESGPTAVTAVAPGIQGALAAVWGKIQKVFEDEDVTPIYFMSTDDVADYIGSANVTMQTAFGLTYVENFLGLGDTIITPALAKGKVVGTAKENLAGGFVPAGTGDVAQTFGLTADETGFIGMTHQIVGSNATIDTIAFSGVKFYPELMDAVVTSTITNAPAAAA